MNIFGGMMKLLIFFFLGGGGEEGIAKLSYFLGVIPIHSRIFHKVNVQNLNIFWELLTFIYSWGMPDTSDIFFFFFFGGGGG